MKKWLVCILSAVIILLLCMDMPVYAEDVAYDDTLSALLDASGTGDLLAEQGMEDAVLPSFEQLLHSLAEHAVDAAAAPLRTCGMLLGVILLSAFSLSLQNESSTITKVYEMISVLCAVSVTAAPIAAVFQEACIRLESSADLMLRFSAVFGAVIAVSGGVTAAAGFQAAMLAICEIAMQISVHLLLPMLGMGLAMGIVDAVNPEISLSGLVQFFHKTVVWLMGLMMSLFLGMLSLQSMAAISTDKLTSKTAKFVVSNAIPFVGSAVSDACSTVMGSMGVLRSTTGIIGIVAVVSLFLPVLLELAIHRFLIAAASAIAEVFAVQSVAKLLKHMESVLACAFSVSVSFAVIFVVSVAVLLLLGGNLVSA